jgi:hypothetical protein
MAKRKTGERHPCGKLKQPNAQERADIAARKARQETAFVENQPHRRGFADKSDPWLESELGRFCRLRKLRRELFDAAMEWANIVRLYRVAWGAPVDEHHGGPGSGQGPSGATLAGWKAQMLAIEEALYGDQGTNKARYSATKALVLDGKAPSRELEQFAIDGLRIVAIELCGMTAREAPHHSEAA